MVHISSGISALLIAIMIGQRAGHGSQPMPPHNLTYTAMGAAMLWIGWFGFNAGSGLAPDGLGSSAFAVTHFSASTIAVAWATMEWIQVVSRGPRSVFSGLRTGLHYACCRLRQPMPSLLMGALRVCLLLRLHNSEEQDGL